MPETSNIFKTIKEVEPINGNFGYSFFIDGITHFVYGSTEEEAFDFVADYIKLYLDNGKSK